MYVGTVNPVGCRGQSIGDRGGDEWQGKMDVLDPQLPPLLEPLHPCQPFVADPPNSRSGGHNVWMHYHPCLLDLDSLGSHSFSSSKNLSLSLFNLNLNKILQSCCDLASDILLPLFCERDWNNFQYFPNGCVKSLSIMIYLTHFRSKWKHNISHFRYLPYSIKYSLFNDQTIQLFK